MLSITFGLVVGMAFPYKAEAANFWQFWHDVGVGSSSGQNVTLTCGWHGACPETGYTSGSALDWAPPDGDAYFAGAAQWNDWYVTNAATAVVTYSPTVDCHRVRAGLANWYSPSITYAYEYFTHVDNPSGNITVYAYSSPYAVRAKVGDAVTSEKTIYCPWEGQHVHQYGSGWAATNWGGFPIGAQCNLPNWTSCGNPRTNQQWMHYESWTY